MHDRHGNEIHLRDVVKVAANEYLPEMHGPHAFAAGQMLLPVAKYGLVIALYPAATSCNVCVALPLITNEPAVIQPDLQTLGPQVGLHHGSWNASDVEVVRSGDGRALDHGPHAAPAWWTSPAPVSTAAPESGPALDWPVGDTPVSEETPTTTA